MDDRVNQELNTELNARNSIKISVRNLVEFILRSGDIDNRRKAGTPGPENALTEGGRIHRMIQKRMGPDYRAEVFLRQTVSMGEFDVVVEGRADGILETVEDGIRKVTVDEIKGVYRELSYMKEPVDVHLAQAKCYAHFYAAQNGLDEITVQMTYCNMETEEIRRFQEVCSAKALQRWFDGIMGEYRRWAVFQYEWKKRRQESIERTVFPYPYREGQFELASQVYRTIYHRKKLFLEAPTGAGKTISAVFPAVKAVGRGLGDKIFYLTAKTITRTVAEETFQLLRGKGLCYKTLVITARDKACFLDKSSCNPEDCPYAKGHYDRVNDAVYDCLTAGDSFTRETIGRYAQEYRVCPYEMSLDLSLLSDAVICDYNYVFDPNVFLKRFFSDGIRGDYLFLIDEAHNLVDRGREMYSAELFKEDFLELKKTVKDYDRKLYRQLESCNRQLLEIKRECGEYLVLSSPGSLPASVMRAAGQMEIFLEKQEHAPLEVREAVKDFYLELRHFLNICERVDENYTILAQHTEDRRFQMKLMCMDPSVNLKECLAKGNSAILFSATLLPLPYYFSLLGGEEGDYAVYAESSFDVKKRTLLIGRDVSSRYSRRNELEYYHIACYIHEIVTAKTGNYLLFFPSHSFLQQVYEIYEERFADERTECVVQTPGMREDQKEAFLNRFEGNGGCDIQAVVHMKIEFEEEKTLLGFCVMGGIFSEGIDLKNDSLIGTVIVGTGLPQVCRERELMKEFFDGRAGRGFDYAYRYPGMNKVLQAAGRVIRTAEDTGVIALLDERFLDSAYQKMFPREWRDYQVCGRKEIGETVRAFWDQW